MVCRVLRLIQNTRVGVNGHHQLVVMVEMFDLGYDNVFLIIIFIVEYKLRIISNLLKKYQIHHLHFKNGLFHEKSCCFHKSKISQKSLDFFPDLYSKMDLSIKSILNSLHSIL